MRVIFRAWVRVSLRGFWSGLTQVRWWVRAVSSVANCVAVSPVVRWWVTVFSGVALRILLAFYPQFFAVWWGCCLVGGCGVVSYF